jgi:hypothetical protein
MPVSTGTGPVVRTVHECLQSVLCNDAVGVAPLAHTLPEGLVTVALTDMPPSPFVVAWSSANPSPLIQSFVRITAATLM